MFQWADSLGVTSSIGMLRDWMAHLDNYLPNCMVFSLPFALWVLAYFFFINSIWMGLWQDRRFEIKLNYEPIYNDPLCEALTMGITRDSELEFFDQCYSLL
jgi:hypothetical protein